MSKFIESLKRLFVKEKITKEDLDKLNITQEEYDYIIKTE